VDETALSRGRLFAHTAPGALAWLFLLGILGARSIESEGLWRVFGGLWPIELCVVALSLAGGVAAFWLPTRALRIGVAVGSLLGAVLLDAALGAVMLGATW